jgi:ribosomal-protein-alanine N-acetyltransferase
VASFPILETSRLHLTEVTASDSHAVFELFADENVVRFYAVACLVELAQAEQLIQLWRTRFESGLGIRWGVRLRESHELIGTCGFNTWSSQMRAGTIGFDLKPTYWGRGMVSEALRAALSAAFGAQLPCGELNRVQADVVAGNVRSENVLRALGFQDEGLRRECAYWKNSYHDMRCFGLLRREFDLRGC